jgi:hypothetical protein
MLLLQETTREGARMIGFLKKKVRNWDIPFLDDNGNSGGLLTTWRKPISLLNYSMLDSGLWT